MYFRIFFQDEMLKKLPFEDVFQKMIVNFCRMMNQNLRVISNLRITGKLF